VIGLRRGQHWTLFTLGSRERGPFVELWAAFLTCFFSASDFVMSVQLDDCLMDGVFMAKAIRLFVVVLFISNRFFRLVKDCCAAHSFNEFIQMSISRNQLINGKNRLTKRINQSQPRKLAISLKAQFKGRGVRLI
jgi:hypothetical protein